MRMVPKEPNYSRNSKPLLQQGGSNTDKVTLRGTTSIDKSLLSSFCLSLSPVPVLKKHKRNPHDKELYIAESPLQYQKSTYKSIDLKLRFK